MEINIAHKGMKLDKVKGVQEANFRTFSARFSRYQDKYHICKVTREDKDHHYSLIS